MINNNNDNNNKGNGKTGLLNVGNTCFLNSCIQIMNHTYELNDIYNLTFEKHKKDELIETQFFKEWILLRNKMWENNSIISPTRFVNSFYKLASSKGLEIFSGFSQNDIHEFIHIFIESLHISISRNIDIDIIGTSKNMVDEVAIKCYKYLQVSYKNEYSELLNLYYGISISNILSIDKKTIYSTVPETFFILDLPIPESSNKIDIYDCLNLYVKEELMEGDNSWWNEEKNEKERVLKNTTFWNFPQILVISFKRFSPCGRWKRNDNIDFPINSLDLSSYTYGYNAHKYKYDLFGVCNHYGNNGGGHYTAFVKNYLDEWMHFNDEIVDSININDYNNIVSPASYCLFYRIQK